MQSVLFGCLPAGSSSRLIFPLRSQCMCLHICPLASAVVTLTVFCKPATSHRARFEHLSHSTTKGCFWFSPISDSQPGGPDPQMGFKMHLRGHRITWGIRKKKVILFYKKFSLIYFYLYILRSLRRFTCTHHFILRGHKPRRLRTTW